MKIIADPQHCSRLLDLMSVGGNISVNTNVADQDPLGSESFYLSAVLQIRIRPDTKLFTDHDPDPNP